MIAHLAATVLWTSGEHIQEEPKASVTEIMQSGLDT